MRRLDVLDAVHVVREVTSVDAAVPLVIWFGGALFGSAATLIACAIVRHYRSA